MKAIRDYVSKGVGKYGDIRDFNEYFTAAYKDNIIAKYPQYNIALLTSAKVQEYANKLKKAFFGVNDNAEIINVFSNLRSGVELSQVSSYYHAVSGSTLLSQVMDMSEKYKIQVTDIIKNYKTFQVV
jgi:hypothetical protein